MTDVDRLRQDVAAFGVELAVLRQRAPPDDLIAVAFHELHRATGNLAYWLEQLEWAWARAEPETEHNQGESPNDQG